MALNIAVELKKVKKGEGPPLTADDAVNLLSSVLSHAAAQKAFELYPGKPGEFIHAARELSRPILSGNTAGDHGCEALGLMDF